MTAFGVDFSKPIQTRHGKPARLLCQGLKGDNYPVVAIVDNGDEEIPFRYTSEGLFLNRDMPHDYDLVNVPEVVETKLKLQCCECRIESNGWMHFRFDNNAYHWHFEPEETYEIFTALCRVQFDVFGDNSKQKENGNHSHE
jgi:hypothetical protein